MSNEIVMGIIEDRLQALLGGSVPIAWDNADYRPARGTAFVNCEFEQVANEQIAIKCFREAYAIQISVLTPSNEGVKNNVILCDTILADFLGTQDDGLIVFEGRAERAGQVEEWHQRDVLLGAYYDQNNT